MVTQTGKSKAGRSSKGRLNYFFLDDKLHNTIEISRPRDTILTWCYPLGKRVVYTYSDVLRRYKPAWTTRQVSAMIGRHTDRIQIAISTGGIETPQYTYGLSEQRKKHAYMWSDKDIMNLHDYFLDVHRGRPRNDGRVTPGDMPSKAELRAMMSDSEALYRMDENGEFRPVWRAN